MAFDQGTRNRLQRLVSDCRKTLTDEFTLQLQQDYGLDPRTGEVTELSRLTHLSDRERHTAALLRETLAHYLAGEGESKAQRQAAIDRIIREQAFTVLNRLAALLMMEARGLLLPAVSQGVQSQAFELYRHVAGTALGETGEAYQTFLFSLFDEFALDLPALFDRFAPQGRLFPRETALNELLALLNDHEIEPLWALDETIGWIYQYFNSQEERKAMRKASQAPRNSRELAVRNQFFTPRYVVEFLVDNTLGRQWFNATGGTTPLRDSCQYLLVKPDEQPETGIKLRDPRTLKLLDPACGSMHFGLYAFDLFLQIYRDAWQWEQQHGPGSLDLSTQPEAGFEPLCHTYADEEALLRDVPRLIIEHNIYGVDIDPRAAQIASLALWLRAQRAWHEAGVQALERPDVGRGNVIAAVAPPAEKELREAFMARLDRQDAELFEKTLQMLKGLPELGVLLRAEKELPSLIRQVYVGKGNDLYSDEEQETWQKAEERLRRALLDFSEEAGATYQSRLFAQDALQGLRMIDLCRVVFDVVVMNPPFGLAKKTYFESLKINYPDSYVDLYACFVSRAVSLCKGRVGAITSRSFLITKKLTRLRENSIIPKLESLLDLGWPVMDDATVQSAAFTLNCTKEGVEESFVAIDRKAYEDKSYGLAVDDHGFWDQDRVYVAARDAFEKIPQAKILYNFPKESLGIFSIPKKVGNEVMLAKQGMKSFSDFRFLRLRHEVSPKNIGRGSKWVPLSKGGAYAVFYSDLPLLINWEQDGYQICEVNRSVNGQVAQARQASVHYYKSGGTYSRRCKDFGVRVLPEGFIIGEKGPAVLPLDRYSPLFVVGLMNARLFNVIINLQANAKQYDTGIVESCPLVNFDEKSVANIEGAASSAIASLMHLSQREEGDALFVTPFLCDTLKSTVELYNSQKKLLSDELERSLSIINSTIDSLYGVDSQYLEDIVFSDVILDDGEEGVVEGEVSSALSGSAGDLGSREIAFKLISYLVGCVFGRWDIRYATKDKATPPLGSFFGALPNNFPGSLEPEEAGDDYPLCISNLGVLADDEGGQYDILSRVNDAFCVVWDEPDALVEEILVALGYSSLRTYLGRPNAFFLDHLNLYTKSRRKAPIYWPLATASSSYTLWLYYPDLTDQTLFTAVNDFVEPKLKQVDSELGNLRLSGASRSRADEKRLEELSDFRDELADLQDTLLKIAPGYKPNHDDGVQITAAPLWPLFRHKPWQKVLKETWEKLEQGDYDWAHLAMAYWPERVREKCVTDKSLAIAHGLEHLYVEPEPAPKKTRGRKKSTGSSE